MIYVPIFSYEQDIGEMENVEKHKFEEIESTIMCRAIKQKKNENVLKVIYISNLYIIY